METEGIIKNIHSQWLIAKEQRRLRCEASNMDDVAHKLAECKMFKGTETLEELAQLFLSPQGLEFCLAANFPSLATLRIFKKYDTRRLGFYIDAGTIRLKNPGKVVLIGRTNATIECDTCEAHTVVTMHGATATVVASGWAVVRTEAGIASGIIKRTSANAIIL